jgi:hypothetical protein
MSNRTDLKVARDVARATAARFIGKAARHLVRAADPDFKGNERLLSEEARRQAKKWTAIADQISEMINKHDVRKSDPASGKTISSR